MQRTYNFSRALPEYPEKNLTHLTTGYLFL